MNYAAAVFIAYQHAFYEHKAKRESKEKIERAKEKVMEYLKSQKEQQRAMVTPARSTTTA